MIGLLKSLDCLNVPGPRDTKTRQAHLGLSTLQADVLPHLAPTWAQVLASKVWCLVSLGTPKGNQQGSHSIGILPIVVPLESSRGVGPVKTVKSRARSPSSGIPSRSLTSGADDVGCMWPTQRPSFGPRHARPKILLMDEVHFAPVRGLVLLFKGFHQFKLVPAVDFVHPQCHFSERRMFFWMVMAAPSFAIS